MKKMYENPKTSHEAVVQMHRMVAKLAHKAIRNHRQDFEDVYSIGMMGVVRAFNDFDTTKSNAKFTTLAYRYAQQHIMDHYKRKQYDYYNSLSGREIDDSIVDSIDGGAIASLTLKETLEGMSTVEKIATVGRMQGYTFAEIAARLNTVKGNNYTLHQVRRIQLAAVDRAVA